MGMPAAALGRRPAQSPASWPTRSVLQGHRPGGSQACRCYGCCYRMTQMIVRNVKLVFVANAIILFCGVVTSLLSAWALGPAGRGDLLVVTLWPPVCALLMTFGLDQAHRYWVAREPEFGSMLFSNAILFALIAGPITVAVSELVIPHVVGERNPETMRLVRIYLVNIPAALIQFLMIGLLEGARRFGWAGASRLMFFVVQAAA